MLLRKMTKGFVTRAMIPALAITGTILGSPIASADSSAPPPAYAGPVSTCPGTLRIVEPLRVDYPFGATQGSTLQIWYRPAPDGHGGTYCAMTFDNLTGSHHTEVVVRREGWTTSAYDSDTYTTFAGGMIAYGTADAGKHLYVFGRVTNGVNYEARLKCSPGAPVVCERLIQ